MAIDGRKLIVSRAHDVVQALPLESRIYVCMRCGLRGDLARLFGTERCKPTLYAAGSGWNDESTEAVR